MRHMNTHIDYKLTLPGGQPMGRVDILMGGYMRLLQRHFPEPESLYIIKFQEFSMYARRSIRIVATFFPKSGHHDQVIGGLVSLYAASIRYSLVTFTRIKALIRNL
jgi:hypothetical protein